MLASVALILAAQTPGERPFASSKSLDEIKAMLAAAGYPARATGPKGQELRIEREGSAAVVEPYNGSTAVRLWAQVAVPAEVEPAALPEPAPSSGARFPFRARPHLGKTVDATQSFVLKDLAAPDALRAALDRFFADAEAVARSVGGKATTEPRRDWGRVQLDDAATLLAFDQESLNRAAASWGWMDYGFPDPVFNSVGYPLQVAGRRVWMRPAQVEGKRSATTLELVLRDPDDKGVPIKIVRVGSEGRFVDIPTLDRREHPDDILEDRVWYRVRSRAIVDLAPGVTLGELRRRVEAFARQGPLPAQAGAESRISAPT